MGFLSWFASLCLMLIITTTDGRLLQYGGKLSLFGRGNRPGASMETITSLPDLRKKMTETPPVEKSYLRNKGSAEALASLGETEASYVSYLPDYSAAHRDTISGHHVVPHADLPSSIKNLVSSVKGFALFGKTKPKQAFVEPAPHEGNKNIYHPLLQRGFEHFRTLTEVLGRFIDQKKGHIVLGGKVAAGLWIGEIYNHRYPNVAKYLIICYIHTL